ncbi:MAG: NADH-quinone oxidoreductase subunit F, partial [Pygmaiobacter massiliensis]
MYRSYVMVCSGQTCGNTLSDRIAEEFEVQIKLAGLRQEVQVLRGGCLGICGSGPNVAVFPEGTLYSHVKLEDVAELVAEHLLKGKKVNRLLYDENEATNTVRSLSETAFYKKQMRVALRNCGVINPRSIEEYIARDGYA